MHAGILPRTLSREKLALYNGTLMEHRAHAAPNAYAPFPWFVMRSREEAEEEMRRPCGRFKSPDLLEESLKFFVAEHMRRTDPLGEEQLFMASGVPLNWQRLLAYLHEKTIIEEPRFFYERIPNDRPKIPNFSLTLSDTTGRTDGRAEAGAGFGSSLSPEDALSKTVGEALERYFLSIYRRETMRYGSFASLRGRNALDITQLNGFLPFQKRAFPGLGCNAEASLHWVTGEEFPSRKKALLPAQLVFWNYSRDISKDANKEGVLAQSTTSGCAGHFSKEEAVLSGLLELIQRDGFLIFWLNRISPPLLDVSFLDEPELAELIEYVKRYRLEMKFVNTTSDINVPSVTCIVIDNASPDGPIISLGSSTGFDIKELFLHSAMEALAVSNYADSLPTYVLPEKYVPFIDKALGRAQRLSTWKGPRMAERFAFFISGKKQDPRELAKIAGEKKTTSEQLAYVLGEFEKLGKGYETYVYEAKDEALGALGYHVVRTIVPQLVPLYLGEHAATLDSKRLREVPAKLGYKAASEMNPWPHPFP